MPGDLTMLGSPVEVGAISTELKKLWLADQTRTRATLFNFAIICEGEDAMRENTDLLARFVGSHAFRAILIGIAPSAEETEVRAWINAHCYLPKTGAKHVCSEQVSLLVRGDVRTALPNLLFQQLDYDLPLTLWWRANDFEHVHPEVWRWVDRLIFDSQAWSDPCRQLMKLQEAVGSQRTAMCDLAWTRTLHLRQSLAQMFDLPEQAAALKHLRRVAITYAPGSRASAILVLAWLAAQLGWEGAAERGQHMKFRAGDDDILADLLEIPGAGISRVELRGEGLTVIATRTVGTRFLHIEAREPGGRITQHLMPADCEDLASVLDEELASGGRHGVYRKVLAVAEGLL